MIVKIETTKLRNINKENKLCLEIYLKFLANVLLFINKNDYNTNYNN